MMRRSKGQSFMSGAFVFPGGKLDGGDLDPAISSCVHGLAPPDAKHGLQEPGIPDDFGLGLYMAAVRETFEEAGVLLAYAPGGALVDLQDPITSQKFLRYRQELHDKSLDMPALSRREGLRYALDLLYPYAHWITPDIESRRFDTRFFIALLPPSQTPVHDMQELSESRWLTPGMALSEQRAGRFLLMPPTLKIIEEMAGFASLPDLIASIPGREIRPILPQVSVTPAAITVKLPHDPEYTLEAHRHPARPGETSRIILENGLWRTARLEA